MGQTCNGIEHHDYHPEPLKVNNTATFSTAEPYEDVAPKKELSESRLLQSRTSYIKRREESLH